MYSQESIIISVICHCMCYMHYNNIDDGNDDYDDNIDDDNYDDDDDGDGADAYDDDDDDDFIYRGYKAYLDTQILYLFRKVLSSTGPSYSHEQFKCKIQ